VKRHKQITALPLMFQNSPVKWAVLGRNQIQYVKYKMSAYSTKKKINKNNAIAAVPCHIRLLLIYFRLLFFVDGQNFKVFAGLSEVYVE
jgi:hypothetical protein